MGAAGSDGHPLYTMNGSLFPSGVDKGCECPWQALPDKISPFQNPGNKQQCAASAPAVFSPAWSPAASSPLLPPSTNGSERLRTGSTWPAAHPGPRGAQTGLVGRGAAPHPLTLQSCPTPSTGACCPNQQQTPPRGMGKGRNKAKTQPVMMRE